MVVDTNILIACLNAEPDAVATLSEWKREGRLLFISPISLAETLSIQSLTDTEIERIRAFLKNFSSIPCDDRIGEIAGFFRRTYRIEIPDAIIAATAFLHNVPLISRDRQFRKVKEITLVEI